MSWPPPKIVYNPKGGRWVIDKETGKLVPWKPQPRKEVNAPYVRSDEIIGGMRSMVTGRIHDSKSSLRREYRNLGYIEVGNDIKTWNPKRPDPTDQPGYKERLVADIDKAYTQIRDGNAPISELERERHKIVNRNLERKP